MGSYPGIDDEERRNALLDQLEDDPVALDAPEPSPLDPQIGHASSPMPTQDLGLSPLAPSPTYTPPPYNLTDFGGGIKEQQDQQIADARNDTPQAAVDPAKWANPDHNTVKYRALSILQGGGQIGDVLRDPLFAGWRQVGPDKIAAPDGVVFDLRFDQEGQNTLQWVQEGDGPNDPRPGTPEERAAANGGTDPLTGYKSGSPYIPTSADPRPGTPEERAAANGGIDPLTSAGGGPAAPPPAPPAPAPPAPPPPPLPAPPPPRTRAPREPRASSADAGRESATQYILQHLTPARPAPRPRPDLRRAALLDAMSGGSR